MKKIVPLDTIAEYEALSQEELSARQANVYNAFVSFALTYSNQVKTSTDYLLKEVSEYSSVGNYGYSETSMKTKEITLARKLVEADELCGTVLDRLVSFCITKGTIEGVKDKKLLDILNKWTEGIGNLYSNSKQISYPYTNRASGINVVFEAIVERLLVDGDSIVSETWADDVILDGKRYKLPYKINIHDTLLIEIDEDYFSKTGQEKIVINTDNANVSWGKKAKKDAAIPLYQDGVEPFTTHLKLRPKTFSVWGTSYFRRAFHPVANKKKIEALEVNTIEGLINRLTIIKAGKLDSETEDGIIAPHRLAVLERLISAPKVNNFILWPGDDIDVEDISPDPSLLTYENKYADANQQILASLGFPRILVDGAENNSENWQKFLGVTADLNRIRTNYLVPWLNSIMKKIAIKNGYPNETPRFIFSRIQLHDLKALLDAVKVFYDRGLMSELSAITSGDLDYNIEHSRREVESTDGIISQFGGPGYLPYAKNTEDGSIKDGNTSPEKGITEVDKVAASVNDKDRKLIIKIYEDYLFALHDSYTSKIVDAVKSKNYDLIPNIFYVYRTHMKRDIKEQMFSLFSNEIQGVKIDSDLLPIANEWVYGFLDSFFDDMEKEIVLVIEHNEKERTSLLPDLIAGMMASFKTSRLTKYSSSIYSKAKLAGEITAKRQLGEDRMRWVSTMSEKTCEYCANMHNKVLAFDQFFAEFPPHPHCECYGSTTKDDFSVDIATKDTSNWSKIIK